MSPPEPPSINGLNIGGIVCKSLGTFFCIVSIILKDGPCEKNSEYGRDSACDAALSMGAFGLIADITATPLTFAGASSYMKQRHSSGVRGLMIASWIIYGLQIFTGIALVAVGVAAVVGDNDAVPTGSIVFYIFWTLVGWSFMLIHAERARRSPAIIDATSSPSQVGSISTAQTIVPIASVVSAGPALPSGWEEVSAEDGKKYYYNIATGRTSWQFPVQPPPPPPPPAEDPCPPAENPAVSAPPACPYRNDPSGACDDGNNRSVAEGESRILSSVTETYNDDGTLTVREERTNPDGSTTVSITTTPNASAASASMRRDMG